MSVTIEHSNYYGALNPKVLEDMESGLGEPLPAEYRRLLAEHNGGVPQPSCFVVPGDEEYDGEPSERQMACFFAAHDRPWKDDTPEGSLGFPLQEAWRDFARKVPGETAVPVGKDWNGSYICVGYAGEGRGRVYFYDHDYEELRPLAESLAVFLGSLHPCEEG